MKNFPFLFILVALVCCKKNEKSNSSITSNPNYEKAKEFKISNLDSAFAHFNLAKNDFLTKKDSVGAAKSLINMAIIQSDLGDYYGSIETSLEADKYLETAKEDVFVNNLYSSNYNNLAISSKSLKNYSQAEAYYIDALKTTDKEKYKLVIQNNIGDVLILQNKTDSAIKLLENLVSKKDSISYARILNNLAKAKFLKNNNYNALPELEHALKIRKLQKDSLGINSSFATLADFFKKKNKSRSLFYAKQMLERAYKNKSPDDQLEALEKIINLDEKNHLKYFSQFQKLQDSLQTSRNKAKNQFAIIRYDVEKLKADNAERDIQVLRQSFGLGLLATILVVGHFWNERRKKNIRREKEQEKKLEVKNTELRYSKKVHDVVANGLYHIMIYIENNMNFNTIKVLDDIEKLYEESRDISHENRVDQDFSVRFTEMISYYNSPHQKVLTQGYNENIWQHISENAQLEILYIIRELLVNMKKHSQAKLVSLKFETNDDALKIRYTDNGIGIQNLEINKGTGIQNTENRIAAIGGDINFEKNPNGGLIIKITIPINSKYV